MRRNVILATGLALGLVGCSNFRDLFSAHADLAAEAGGQQLSSQRLAQIMGGPKGARISREAADFFANVWVDYSLLGQAVAEGKLPLDSASVAEAVWPELTELKGSHWHDTLMARRSAVTDASIDSLYQSPDVRLLQHILFSARTATDTAQKAEAKQKAEAALAQIRKGADFGKLALTLSQDPGSKADSGYLPPSPRGRFVPAFDSAGWTLAPGQVSGLVETPFGYHIIKRPALEAGRGRLADYLKERAGIRLDSLYMDSIATASKMEVVSGAPATMRSAAASPDQFRTSDKALVKYNGGALTVKDYLRWVRALPAQYTSQLQQAPDSMLERFARILTQNVLLLQEADVNKISITPTEWASLKQRYDSELDTLRMEMGLQGGDLTDSSIATRDREKVAGLKVETYLDKLVQGKGRLRPLPAALATLLRERFPYRIHDAGLNRAVEIATEAKAKADSASPKGAMQQAPGGPPVPGLQPRVVPGAPVGPGAQAPGSRAPGARPPAPQTPAQPKERK
jgi:hypothetical protein